MWTRFFQSQRKRKRRANADRKLYPVIREIKHHVYGIRRVQNKIRAFSLNLTAFFLKAEF